MWTRTLNKKSCLLPSSLTLDGLSANDDDEDPAAPAANSTNAKWADGWRAECSMTSVRFDSISNLARALMCCKTMIIPRMMYLIERVLSNNGYGCWQTNPLRGRIANLRGQPLLVSYRYPIMRQTTKQTRTYTASKLKWNCAADDVWDKLLFRNVVGRFALSTESRERTKVSYFFS